MLQQEEPGKSNLLAFTSVTMKTKNDLNGTSKIKGNSSTNQPFTYM